MRLSGIRQGLSRFVHVPWGRKLVVIRAAVLLLLARSALVAMPFARVAKVVERTRPRRGNPPPDGDLEAMLWAIRRVGDRLFPGNPCLPQAIVAQRVLRRAGRPAELRISVRKDRRGRFGAHAWVESGARIVMGGEVLAQGFVPLPPLGAGEPES